MNETVTASHNLAIFRMKQVRFCNTNTFTSAFSAVDKETEGAVCAVHFRKKMFCRASDFLNIFLKFFFLLICFSKTHVCKTSTNESKLRLCS